MCVDRIFLRLAKAIVKKAGGWHMLGYVEVHISRKIRE